MRPTERRDPSRRQLLRHPVCPFTWKTRKWVRMVMARRDWSVDWRFVDWRFVSLRLINAHIDYDEDFPRKYEAGHTTGLRFLRMAARGQVEWTRPRRRALRSVGKERLRPHTRE
jgi:hypothetical protein